MLEDEVERGDSSAQKGTGSMWSGIAGGERPTAGTACRGSREWRREGEGG